MWDSSDLAKHKNSMTLIKLLNKFKCFSSADYVSVYCHKCVFFNNSCGMSAISSINEYCIVYFIVLQINTSICNTISI